MCYNIFASYVNIQVGDLPGDFKYLWENISAGLRKQETLLFACYYTVAFCHKKATPTMALTSIIHNTTQVDQILHDRAMSSSMKSERNLNKLN